LKLPKIILDLDGVVVNFYQKLIVTYNSRFPDDTLTLDDINCELEQLGPERAERLIEIFNEPGYFANLEPLPGTVNVVSHYVSVGYQIIVCTAPPRLSDGRINGASAGEKFGWLNQHLPILNKIIITRSKEFVDGDLFIDDTPYQVLNWCQAHPNGIGLLVDQPWNKRWQDLPRNAIRANLEDVGSLVSNFWCKETDRFAYRAYELRNWKR
jgi:5'(3')-deoxyribonucleotidase